MLLPFSKIQCAGNDYIYIDLMRGNTLLDIPKLAVSLSKRRLSVGSDGIITISRSTIGDSKMTIYNADGSIGKICGNGLIGTGKLLWDRGYVRGDKIHIETDVGIRTISVGEGNMYSRSLTVDMGEAKMQDSITIKYGKRDITSYIVNVGNPHLVILGGVSNFKLKSLQRQYDSNIESISKVGVSPSIKIYERGSGETFACGSGAVAVGCVMRHIGYGDTYHIQCKGGVLGVEYREGIYYLTNTANTVYDGVAYVK